MNYEEMDFEFILRLPIVHLSLILNPQTDIMSVERAERLGVTKRTIEREIKQLRETVSIERIGSKRFGHWKINN